VFLNYREETSIICVSDIPELISESADSEGIFSISFDQGAITVSFDMSEDHRRRELHLVGWGVMQDYVKQISSQFSGTLY
jgi:hypothetical protein